MGNFTTVTTRVGNPIVTAAEWNSEVGQNLNLGVFRQLAETVLSGAASSIDFTSIPATFRHLMLVIDTRLTGAVTGAAVGVRFNGDSGANYDMQFLQANNLTVSSGQTLAGTSIANIGSVPGASATAGLSGLIVATIPNYRGTTFQKTIESRNTLKRSTAAADFFVQAFGGWWRSAAAINQITLIPGSGNFDVGTVATLYGLPA